MPIEIPDQWLDLLFYGKQSRDHSTQCVPVPVMLTSELGPQVTEKLKVGVGSHTDATPMKRSATAQAKGECQSPPARTCPVTNSQHDGWGRFGKNILPSCVPLLPCQPPWPECCWVG
jgi:hypothetical protein